MTDAEIADFVTRFAAAWAARDGEAFLALWHPDGLLHTPLVGRPVIGSELARLLEVQKEAAPDFVWQLLDWTSRGDVVIIPTPGHTPHHVSVAVLGDVSFLLAGDTSYNESLLLAGKVDGVSPNPGVARQTHAKILSLAAERPLVYLPSHDPNAERRLREKTPTR